MNDDDRWEVELAFTLSDGTVQTIERSLLAPNRKAAAELTAEMVERYRERIPEGRLLKVTWDLQRARPPRLGDMFAGDI